MNLKELRNKKGVSQQVVSEMIGITRAAYTNIENEKREPDFQTLLKLADYYNVSTDEILERKQINSKGLWVPVLGYVHAGVPLEAIDEILDYEEITSEMAAQGEHFGLTIIGDSMEPRFEQGDVVIVRKQSDIDSGDIAVVLVDGLNATVKKIIKIGTSLMLMPLNNSYEPKIYDQEDIKTLPVEIIGKVVELRGKF